MSSRKGTCVYSICEEHQHDRQNQMQIVHVK
jgi:hypothetical protein